MTSAIFHNSVASLARTLGRRRLGLLLALGMREASRVLIKYGCTDGIHGERNGEFALCRLLAAKATTFFDVGANVGNWSAALLAAMPSAGRGLLFEPSLSATERLRRRFKDASGIHIVNAAVSDRVGEARFFEEPDAGETSSLAPNYSQPTAVARNVEVTTLDAAAAAYGFEYADVLKIDAEGQDLNVLRGAQGMLAQRRIGVVQFEYGRPWMEVGSTLTAAYNLLEPCGYRLYLLLATGLYDFPLRRIGEWFGTSTFVAAAPEWSSQVRPLERGALW